MCSLKMPGGADLGSDVLLQLARRRREGSSGQLEIWNQGIKG